MSNDKISGLIIGMVTKTVSDIMHNENVSFDVAYQKLRKSKTELNKYPLDKEKELIEKKTKEKYESRWGKKPEEDKPKDKEEKPKVKEEIKTEEKKVKEEDNKVIKSEKKESVEKSAEKGFVPPERIKYRGDIKLNDDHTIQKVKGAQKIAIKCPENSHGELVGEDKVGCRLD